MSSRSELSSRHGVLTKNKDSWEPNIPYAYSLLISDSTENRAKALWLFGEIGVRYPLSIKDCIPTIASFCRSTDPVLRERAIHALGRIGGKAYHLIAPYWKELLQYSVDEEAGVRLSFLWASENIAAIKPDLYENYVGLFADLLVDADKRVRMEAPKMFHILGERRPEYVKPYVEVLRGISENDSNYVVRIHCLRAIQRAN